MSREIQVDLESTLPVVTLGFCEDDKLDLELRSVLVGPAGPPGTGEIAASATAGAALLMGIPCAVSPANGKLVPADASIPGLCKAIGLATSTFTNGFPATASQANFVMSDWTAVTGSPALSPGLTYWLAVGGGLSTTPPAIPGQYVVSIGIAANPTTINVTPQPPVQL